MPHDTNETIHSDLYSSLTSHCVDTRYGTKSSSGGENITFILHTDNITNLLLSTCYFNLLDYQKCIKHRRRRNDNQDPRILLQASIQYNMKLEGKQMLKKIWFLHNFHKWGGDETWSRTWSWSTECRTNKQTNKHPNCKEILSIHNTDDHHKLLNQLHHTRENNQQSNTPGQKLA